MTDTVIYYHTNNYHNIATTCIAVLHVLRELATGKDQSDDKRTQESFHMDRDDCMYRDAHMSKGYSMADVYCM